jgi:hypothetical protein
MTQQDGGPAATCQTPIDAVVLADYWLALLPHSQEDRVEEHLLECNACGDRLRGIIQLSEALRRLARSGALRVVVGQALITNAVESGRQVRQYDFAPGQTVACTIAADDDLLVARLAADLSGVNRVDLSFCDPQGIERQRLTDIPVRTDAGRVILHESTVWAKASPSTTMVARLLAVRADCGERLLGEYTFQHTRTIQGPPGWEW